MIEWDKCNNVLSAFHLNGLKISEFITMLVQHSEGFEPFFPVLIDDLYASAGTLASLFEAHPRSQNIMWNWANQCTSELCSIEAHELSRSAKLLHFNAKHAQATKITNFNTVALVNRLSTSAPFLWQLISKLMDSKLSAGGDDDELEELTTGQIATMSTVIRILYAHNRRCNFVPALIGVFLHTCNAPERIVDVLWRLNTSISIGSVNNAINALSDEASNHIRAAGETMLYGYVLDNFDVQLKHKITTVEQSQDTLFHLISGSLVKLAHATADDLKFSSYLWQRSRFNDQRSIQLDDHSIYDLLRLYPDSIDGDGLDRRERFNAWQFMVDICTHGPSYFHQFRSDLTDPESINKIPPVKTVQVPAKAMDLNNSTVPGNIDAVTDLLRQGGVQDVQDYVILFHGDVGTGKRLRSARVYRSIESTPQLRLQYLLFIPGLFHTEMSCADALYRMFLGPKASHMDEASFHAYIHILYPNDSSRISNNKGSFQQLSDCIMRTGTADRLECWRAYIHTMRPECNTLQKFAEQSPTYHELISISKILAKKYNGTSSMMDSVRKKPLEARDLRYENTVARVDYFLLYAETVYSMCHGDVGRIEICLRKWIPIFKGTGKHKYATMLLEFLLDVHFVYPEPLRRVVRYNWLCNPTGTHNGFCGVDWLLELNNLLTKVIYGGSSSNYTIERIIKESSLIQLYRDCKTIVEEQFQLKPKTMRHGRPDFTATYAALSQLAISSSSLSFKPGRSKDKDYQVPDTAGNGMERYETELSGIIPSGDDNLLDPGDPIYEITVTEEEIFYS